jgi:hypothetical protein
MMAVSSVPRKKCIECGARLGPNRLKWHALTCSAGCGHARQSRRRPKPTRPRVSVLRQNPPILGMTLKDAAERIGVLHQLAHVHCVEHGLGRLYNDGRRWLTLSELRTLTVKWG